MSKLRFSLIVYCIILFSCNIKDKAEQEQKKPNIVIIMVDDMGFSDLGCYGGEIETPHLDQLANNGLRFTQFYNTSRCCPTRAALLTGLYQHEAGMGGMTENLGVPSYQGYLNDQCVTIAEALKPAGYYTAISGKWHVGNDPELWPSKRGFDRFYGVPEGGGHHYRIPPKRHLVLDDTPIEAPEEWYSTTAFTDYAVKFIDEGVKSDKSIFLYLAYTAPHWPLQAPEQTVQKFLGRYSNGWQSQREARFKRQMEMGMFPEGTYLSPSTAKDWTLVQNKEEMDRRFAVHAAMIHLIDEGVGRVIARLKALNQLDNTLILFLSDNGASAEIAYPKNFVHEGGFDSEAITGSPKSFTTFGQDGANLSNTPFRKYKSFVHEGGIATPLIAHWPGGIPHKLNGTFNHEVGHIIDLLPTCLALAGASYPTQHNQQKIKPLSGISLIPALQGNTLDKRDLYFEHYGKAAIRSGKWKLVHSGNDDNWELYDLEVDRTELNDLSKTYPDKVSRLTEKWETWAKNVGVKDTRK